MVKIVRNTAEELVVRNEDGTETVYKKPKIEPLLNNPQGKTMIIVSGRINVKSSDSKVQVVRRD